MRLLAWQKVSCAIFEGTVTKFAAVFTGEESAERSEPSVS